MLNPSHLDSLDPQQLRAFAEDLLARVQTQERELTYRQVKIDKLTHELALHKRWRFAARREAFSQVQAQVFEETVEADLAAIETELAEVAPADKTITRQKPKRLPLPPELPRREIRHEPDSTRCACGCELKRIGEDIAEKLDYTPGTFTVERHVRGKWVCGHCETLIQAPVEKWSNFVDGNYSDLVEECKKIEYPAKKT